MSCANLVNPTALKLALIGTHQYGNQIASIKNCRLKSEGVMNGMDLFANALAEFCNMSKASIMTYRIGHF